MFSSIRSFAFTAISLLALGAAVVIPSSVHATPTAETGNTSHSAIMPDPGAGFAIHVAPDPGGPQLVGDGSGPRVWLAPRLAVGSVSRSAAGPRSLATSFSSSDDDDCEVEERRLNASISWCIATAAIPVGKVVKIVKGAAKGAKAGKGAKNGTKGTGGGDDIPKDGSDGFNVVDMILGGAAGLFCWDVYESYWALQECRENQGC